ncbi:unnamed protein product [Brachionus calyciflorus]|uniref:RIIa domain-containing protein n=1 Tax=Brachionus calyciflorus TaxID=104777 RepID=A0A813MWU1_9BILA|nr:unnamed protein product [Brachionus calyciflorus]
MSKSRINKPYGTEDYDRDALTDLQHAKTNAKKIDQRIENEKYLREHPEITLLINDFLKEAYLNKPNDVQEFAAGIFNF